jgi:hypothetical protein
MRAGARRVDIALPSWRGTDNRGRLKEGLNWEAVSAATKTARIDGMCCGGNANDGELGATYLRHPLVLMRQRI